MSTRGGTAGSLSDVRCWSQDECNGLFSTVIMWTREVNVKELVLDGTGWQTKDDFYNAFFCAVGAPEWHGRNLDALADSISGGSINRVEVPYKIVIRSYGSIAPQAREMTDKFIHLVRELAAEGCPVEIGVEGQ